MGTARMTVRIAPLAANAVVWASAWMRRWSSQTARPPRTKPASDAQQRDADRQDQEGREEQRHRQTGPTEAHRPRGLGAPDPTRA